MSAKVIFQAKRPEHAHQREVKLGALRVFVTAIERDSLGNGGVSISFMDSLQQRDSIRFDLLPDEARVLATLLLECVAAGEPKPKPDGEEAK